MPDLADNLTYFSRPFMVVGTGGRKITGNARQPRDITLNMNGRFTPRMIFIATPGAKTPPEAGMIIEDEYQQQWLLANWSADYFGDRHIADQFAMYQINKKARWQRAVTTVEPISGLLAANSLQDLGYVSCLMEPMRADSDGMHIEHDYVRILCNAEIMVGDVFDGKRVRRVSFDQGVTYGEAL